MYGTYTHGELLRIGFDRQDQYGYIMLGNSAWKSLVPGLKYHLVMQFDTNPPWDGDAFAIDLAGGAVVLFEKFTSAEMIKELAGSQAVTISYNGRIVSNLPLTHSSDAVSELISCQKAVDAQTQTTSAPSDPFAQPPDATSQPSDPFSPHP